MADNESTDATTSSTGPGGAVVLFEWLDGTGAVWRLEASPDLLVVQGDAERFTFSREQWRTALTFSPLAGKVVIHLDTGSREIGFLVPQEDARALFVAMGRQVALEQVSDTRAADRAASNSSRSPMWPKMRALPVVALCLSVFAFFPFVGGVFGIAAIVLAVVSLRQARDHAADRHIRTMAKLALVFAAVGLGISAFATYTWNSSPEDFQSWLLLGGEAREWSAGAMIAAFVMVLIGLSVHEAAHAITAWWCGDGYARSQGRVTLNPLAHIDPFGTVLLPLLLVSAGAPVFGYAKPVPVQLANVRHHRRAQILVAAAGPLSNLLQAAICLGLLTLIGSSLSLAGEGVVVRNFSSLQPIVEIEGLAGGKVLAGVALMLKHGFQVNLYLACFNMLPIPPLDGSWITQYLSPGIVAQFYARIRPYGFLIFLVLLFSGGLVYLLGPAMDVMIYGHRFLGKVSGL